MSLWIWVTLFAGVVQTLRFMLQKRLKGIGLSTGGATFSRFLFGAPLAALGAVLMVQATGETVPPLTPAFFAYAVAGGAELSLPVGDSLLDAMAFSRGRFTAS